MDELRDTFHEVVADCYGDPYFAKLLYLKVTNYAIARYHHLRCDVRLTSRPVTLMLDPSNSCQLACPGCVHSTNWPFTNGLLWPAGVICLAEEIKAAILDPAQEFWWTLA